MATHTAESYGCVGDGVTDDTTALNTALSSIPNGDTLSFTGTYRHTNVLTMTGKSNVTLTGGGEIAHDSDVNSTGGLSLVNCPGVVVSNLTLTSTATTRRVTDASHRLFVRDTTGATVSNVTIVGAQGAGILVDNCNTVTITGCDISYTLADSVHITNGTYNVTVSNCSSDHSGDDGCAVVSYSADPAGACHDIAVSGHTVTNQLGGRGLSVVGGYNVTYSDCTLNKTAAAGIYVACEGSYLTRDVDDVVFQRITLTECVQQAWDNSALRPRPADPAVQHGAVQVYSSRDGYHVTGVRLSELTITGTCPDAPDEVRLIINEGTTAVMSEVDVCDVNVVGASDLGLGLALIPTGSYNVVRSGGGNGTLANHFGWASPYVATLAVIEQPALKVEISQSTSPVGTQTWVNETAYCRADLGVSMTHGRADEEDQVQPGRLSLTLDNTSGRFTAGEPNTAGITRIPGQRVRVSAWNGSAYVARFDGLVDGWPVAWDSTVTPLVQLGASDRMKQIARDATLGGPAQTANLLGASFIIPMIGETEAMVVESTWGPLYGAQYTATATIDVYTPSDPPDDIPVWEPSTVSGIWCDMRESWRFTSSVPEAMPTTSVASFDLVVTDEEDPTMCQAFSFWVQQPTSGAGVGTVVMGELGARLLAFTTHATATRMSEASNPLSVEYDYCAGPSIANGLWHHVAVTWDGEQWKLWIDAVSIGRVASAYSSCMPHINIPAKMDGTTALWLGSVHSFAGFPDPLSAEDVEDLYRAGYGWYGETAAQRLDRALTALGITGESFSLDTGRAMSRTITVGSAAEAIRVVETSCGGAFFASKGGVFTFHDAAHRPAETVALTVSADLIGNDFTVALDDTGVQNIATYTRPEAGLIMASGVQYNAASIGRYGERRVDVPLEVDSSVWAAAVSADWAARPVAPEPRASTLTLDLLTTPTIVVDALNLEIGKLVHVTDLPAGAGFDECWLFVEGWAETVGVDQWELKLNTSPGAEPA